MELQQRRTIVTGALLLSNIMAGMDGTIVNTALQRLLGSQANIGKLHGQLLHEKIQRTNNAHDGYELTTDKHWIMPMYHPAAVLYARRLEPTIKADWQQLGQDIKKMKK